MKLPWRGIKPRIVAPGPGNQDWYVAVTISAPWYPEHDGRTVRAYLSADDIEVMRSTLRHHKRTSKRTPSKR